MQNDYYKMHKLYLLFLLTVFQISYGFTQVSFSITDQLSGDPIENVHIYIPIKKQTKVLVTNKNGQANYSQNIHIKDGIKLSHIGYETLVINVNEIKSEYQFSLVPLHNELDNIVLTGDIIPISKKESVYDVITVSEKQIEKLGAVDATQVLKWEKGIRITRDPVLGSSVSINGLSGEHVKIIVDGIEMNGRSDGFVDLEQIQIQEKQSVEVVKGPVSLEYGSNALGGVIQFISHDEDIRDSIGGSIQLLAENTGTYKSTFHFIEARKKHSLNVYFNRTYFDGWNANDVFWEGFSGQVADSNRVNSWNPKLSINGKVKYDLTLNKLRLTNQIFYQNETITERGYPFVAPTYSKAKDSELESHRFFAQSQLKGAFKDHHLFKIIANAQFYNRYRKTFIKDLNTLTVLPNSLVTDTTSYNSFQFRYQAKFMGFNKHKLDYGIDVLYDEIKGQRINGDKKDLLSYGLYIKDRIEINKKAVLQAGVRLSHFTNGKTAITPSLNSKFEFKDQSVLKLSLSRGYRNPGLKDLYFEFIDNNHHIIGNSALKAEQSYHLNTSYSKAVKEKVMISIGSFFNYMTNKIELIQATENSSWFTYGNFSKYQGFGGHIDLSRPIKSWQFNLGYQFISDRILEDRIPNNWVNSHQISSRIQKSIQQHSVLSLALIWNSERSTFRYDDDETTQRFLQEAYTFIDFGYQYKYSQKIELGLWVKNILDVTAITNSNASAHSSSQQNIARGRMLQMQIRLKL